MCERCGASEQEWRATRGKTHGTAEVKCNFYLARKLGAVTSPDCPDRNQWGWSHEYLYVIWHDPEALSVFVA